MSNIHNLKQLVAQNKTKAVLKKLVQIAPRLKDEDLRNEIFLLSNRFESLEQQKRKNTIALEAYQLERNKINNSLLELLDKVEAALGNENGGLSGAIGKSRWSWKTISGTLVAIIGVSAGIAEISGYSIRDFYSSEQTPETETTQDNLTREDKKDTLTDTFTPPQTQSQNTNTPQKKDNDQTRQEPLPPPKTKLTIEIKTNKGKDNLSFKEGELVRLYFKVNQPCKIRSIYQLADSTLVLLDNDRQVNQPEVGIWVELGDGFDVSPPFGRERLYIFAQESNFPALVTATTPDGYTLIKEGLPNALRKTRGLKKRPTFAEDQLQIITLNDEDQ